MHKAYRLKHWKDETYISVDFRGNYYFAIPVRMAEIFHTFEEVEKLIDEKNLEVTLETIYYSNKIYEEHFGENIWLKSN